MTDLTHAQVFSSHEEKEGLEITVPLLHFLPTAQIHFLVSLLFVTNYFISGLVSSPTFTFVNKCDHPVWPGVTSPFNTTGFALQKGESKTLNAPSAWRGRFWGRTQCTEDSRGNFTCVTGDCGSGKLQCSGGPAPPVTLVEFSADATGFIDFYDISLVDGYNLPILVGPRDVGEISCKTIGCVVDLDVACPPELKARLIHATLASPRHTRSCSRGRVHAPTVILSMTHPVSSPAPVTTTLLPFAPGRGVTSPFNTTGFALQKGESKTLNAPSAWRGRFWGRTQCTEDSRGNFTCVTGDCGSGKLQCSGGPAPPVTLVEFSADATGFIDFYDISLVDGYNLPILVGPRDVGEISCKTIGCVVDLDVACPPELKVTSNDGSSVACKGACHAFEQDQYCCTGAFNTRDTCKPSSYSQLFKRACPCTYSYPFDDTPGVFSCAGDDYLITFCPRTSVCPAHLSTEVAGSPYDAPSPLPEIVSSTRKQTNLAAIIAGSSAGAFVLVCIATAILVMRGKRNEDDKEVYIGHVPGMPMRFSYKELRVATEDFKDIIVDIYSFGIVVLEIVCGRKNFDRQWSESSSHLLRLLQKKAKEDKLLDLVENWEEGIEGHAEELVRMIKIAAWCLQDDHTKRPSMSTVVKVLEGLIGVDPNISYNFTHAMESHIVTEDHASAPAQASVLSGPR
ncbi:unnamed protein product [Ilex paraguariensis]|uniref:Uncharacterized protein n=1 Tax=Ilex paraguariensis TaxID=185542 RepID=A0ABC8TLC5_9AQUA